MSDPIEPGLYAVMNDIAALLDDVFKAQGNYGFALLVFDLNAIQGGRMNYISNARREDMISALREQAAYFEGGTHDTPAAKQ